MPLKQGQHGARDVERESAAAAAVLVAIQRRVVPEAVDSGLLLVKYTLWRRLAWPWRGHCEPHCMDCAARRTNYGV